MRSVLLAVDGCIREPGLRRLATALVLVAVFGCHSEPVVVPWDLVIDPSVTSFDVVAPSIRPAAEGGSMVKGGGWGVAEGTQRRFWWVGETSAELWFPHPPANEVDLLMVCRPFSYAGSPDQEMELVVNGELVGGKQLQRGWKRYRIPLPTSALDPVLNHLELRFTYATSPADVGVSGDTRTLAAAFRELAVVARDLAHDPPAPCRYDRPSGQLMIPPGAGVAVPLPASVRGALRLGDVDCDREDAQLVVELLRPGGELEVLWRGNPSTASRARVAFENDRNGMARLLLRHEPAGPSSSDLHVGFGPESLRMWRTARPPSDPSRPHVFIYVVDALRADALEVYPSERSLSPRLTEFSRDAVTYRTAIAPSTWTLPSVVSLLSGQYPHRHGVGIRRFGFESGLTPSLARLLRAQDYDTVAVSHSRVVGPRLIADMGFETAFYADSVTDRLPKSHRTRRLISEWLMQRGQRDAPVFGYVHTVVPHAPYTPGGAYRRFADANPSDLQEGSFRPYRFQIEGHIDSARDLAHLRALYEGEVACADANFGLFIDLLEYLGLYDQALIIFTSDHGEEFGEHRGFGHGRNLFREQTRIPLLVRYPGGRGAGTEVEARVSTVDLVRTIEEVIGADWDELGPDGKILPGGVGTSPGTARGQRAIVSETKIGRFETLRAVHSRAVFIGQLKCVENLIPVDQFGGDLPRFLAFDLAADPDDRQPLEANDPRMEECREALAEIAASAEKARLRQPQAVDLDPSLKEALKALGYMN